ncbi:MAG TPA: tetratricopeptide repeat protein [Candidatus Hypogeohydataceae bacterium YC41]
MTDVEGEAKLVLRKKPLEEIQKILDSSQRAVIQISGPQGIGKSVFIEQLKEQLHLRYPALCTGYYVLRGSESNRLFLEILSQILGQWMPSSREDLNTKASLFKERLLFNWRELATGIFRDIIASVSEHLNIKTRNTSKELSEVFKEVSKEWSTKSSLEELIGHRKALFTIYLKILQAVSDCSQQEERFLIIVDQAESGTDSYQKFLVDLSRNLPKKFFLIFGLNDETPGGRDFLHRHGQELQRLGTKSVEIPGFNIQEIQELIRLFYGPEVIRNQLETIINKTGGNTLIIYEWVRSNFDEKAITNEVSKLQGYYAELLRSCPEESQNLARTLSLLSAPLPGGIEDYFQLTKDKTITACHNLLDNLVRKGIFDRRGGDYWFKHELIKDFIFSDTTLPVKKELARDILSLLKQKYPDEIKLVKTISRPLHIYAALLIYSEDREECYRVNTDLGERYNSAGEYLPALECLSNCLKSYKDLKGKSATLNSIGLVYDGLSNYTEALRHHQEALTILQKLGDCAGEGNALNNIGLAYRRMGSYTEALRYYQEARRILHEVRDGPGEGATLNNIGLVYRRLGKYPEAIKHFQEARRILHKAGDRQGEGNALNNIGAVYRHTGNYTEAMRYYQEARKILREGGDRTGEGNVLNNIGGVYQRLGNYTEALRHCQEAKRILHEIGDRTGEGNTLNNICGIYLRLGNYAEALKHCQEALKILHEVADRAAEGNTLNNIGMVYDNLGNYTEALRHYQEARRILREVGDRPGEGIALINIATILEKDGEIKEAVELLEKVVETDKQTKNPDLNRHTAYLEELRKKLK